VKLTIFLNLIVQ